MKTPLKTVAKNTIKIFQNKILNPIVAKSKPHEIKGLVERFVDFYFDKSQDATSMLLFFDAISLLTSTMAQINVQKKRNDPNKEYLIEQQKSEFKASLPLTIIFPFIVVKFLGRQLSAGRVMTKSTRELVEKVIKPYLGYTPNDGYYIPPLKTIKEILHETKNSLLTKIRKIAPEKYKNYIKIIPIDPNKDVPGLTLKDLLFKFDQQVADELKQLKSQNFEDIKFFKSNPYVKEILDKKPLFKKSAVAHVNGEIEGIKILTLIALNVITANIIMPIIKNKITNNRHKKELAAMGEDLNSKRRKDHYNKLKGIDDKQEKNIFEAFSNFDNSTTRKPLDNKPDKTIYRELMKPKEENNIFRDINTFSTQTTQSSRLRI